MTTDLKADLEQALSTRTIGLRFPVALEEMFHQNLAEPRARAALRGGIFGLFMYVGFLLVDWLVVPDVFLLALILRLGTITPLRLMTLVLLSRHLHQLSGRLGTLIADWTGAVSGWASAITLVALQLCSESPHAYFYHAGLVVVLLYTTLLQAMRFKVAVVTALCMLAMHVVAEVFGEPMPEAVKWPMIELILFTVGTCLLANYLAELRRRRRFLLGLQDELILAELETAQEALQRLSRLDALTQVANRRHFDEHLGHVWSRASQDGGAVSMLMIDIDHFKAYNDAHGHPAGDACLQAVARALLGSTRRPDDLVARLGGEEFGVILQDPHADMAQRTAERVCQAVAALALPHGQSPTADCLTVSVGVATVPAGPPPEGATALVEHADQALYEAKRAGRNRVKVWAPPASHSAVA